MHPGQFDRINVWLQRHRERCPVAGWFGWHLFLEDGMVWSAVNAMSGM